jgi:hypothetical protein
MSAPLTLLVTANLAGRLDRLPRLFPLIQRVRADAAGPVLTLDLGGACDPAAWEGAATEGRATLFVLDAMGYDGACLAAQDCRELSSDAAAKLLEGTHLALCGPSAGLPDRVTMAAEEWQVALTASGTEAAPPGLALVVRPLMSGEEPYFEERTRTLWLAGPPGDRLGVAHIMPGGSAAVTWRMLAIPPDARPDATVAAAVEFVRDEARFYLQQRLAASGPTGAADAM